MIKFPWFRMYVDFLEDPKIIGLAFEDQRHFIGLLALKSSGVLDQDCTPEMMNRIVAQKIWIDHAIIVDVKKRLVNAGLIDKNWQPLAWEKRQQKSDRDHSGAERQRKFREKNSNALRNGCVTGTEEIREEEKEKRKDIDISFDDFYKAYPKKVGKVQAAKAWEKIPDSIKQMIIDDVNNRRINHKTWLDGFPVNPATYLNNKRWEDEIELIKVQSGKNYETNTSIGRKLSLVEQGQQSIDRIEARERREQERVVN